MRVITGTARGRKLSTPDNYDVRPTTDNVKESLFNIINFDIEGRKFLDLFAGTGQIGIEALSRGAASVTFVDSNAESIKLIKKNIKVCGFNSDPVHMDSVRYLETCGKYDIIFIDPPYDSGLYEQVLKTINSVDILSPGGIIICESRRETVIPGMDAPYFKRKEYNYGKVKLTFFARE